MVAIGKLKLNKSKADQISRVEKVKSDRLMRFINLSNEHKDSKNSLKVCPDFFSG